MKEYVKLEYPTLKIAEINQVLKFMEKLAIPLDEAVETLYFNKVNTNRRRTQPTRFSLKIHEYTTK